MSRELLVQCPDGQMKNVPLTAGRLAIGRARIKRMEIDELVVKKIRITDSLEMPGTARPR